METVIMFYPEDSCLCIRKADYPRMARKAGLQAQDLSWERWVAHRAAGRKVLIVNAHWYTRNVAELIVLGMTHKAERVVLDMFGAPDLHVKALGTLVQDLDELLGGVEITIV